MSDADAVAVFRPRDLERLKPFLDLDDESESSDGLYAELLEDGAVLVHTFQPFAAFAEDPGAGAEWLAQFGEALAVVHDDPRGLLVFPDTLEPEGRTYEAVLQEVEHDGVWIGPEEGDPAAFGIDIAALSEMAGRMAQGGAAPTSFELGQVLSGVQQQVLDALALVAEQRPDGDVGEGEDDEPVSTKK